MITAADEKFLESKQEALRLDIALERFFVVFADYEWQERYRTYLKKRFRPAILRLIELNEPKKIEAVFSFREPDQRNLDEFLSTAGKANRPEIFDLLLREKRKRGWFEGWKQSTHLEEHFEQSNSTQENAGADSLLRDEPETTEKNRSEWNKCRDFQTDREQGSLSDAERKKVVIHQLCVRAWRLIVEKFCVQFPRLRALWCGFTFEVLEETVEKTVNKAVKKTENIGTDGADIFYHEIDFLKLYYEDSDVAERWFLHMACHVLLSHMFLKMPEEQNKRRIWNLACDVAAEHLAEYLWENISDGNNKEIRETTNAQNHLEEQNQQLAEIEHAQKGKIDAVIIYEELMTRDISENVLQTLEQHYGRDSHSFWEDADGKKQKQTAMLAECLQNLGNGNKSRGGQGGRGSSAGSAKEKLTLAKKRKITYRDFLERFMTGGEEIGLDLESFDYIPYLFGLSYYRDMPLIEHLEYREVRKMSELVIAIDTSGSCTKEMVQRFLEETYAILSDRRNFFAQMNVFILQCDFCIQQEVQITSQAEWEDYVEHLSIQGRSGTDFRAVFERVGELRKEKRLNDLQGLLYFTDGDGIYPEEPTDYDTAFLFYREKEGHPRVPEWAWVIQLDGEKDEY